MCSGNKVDPIEIRSARGQRKKVNWRSYSHVERKMVLLTLYPQILNKAPEENSISGLLLKWAVGEVLEYWPSTAVINKCWCGGLSLWEGLPRLAFAFCLGLSSPLCYWTNLLNSTHQLGCYLFQEALSDTAPPRIWVRNPFCTLQYHPYNSSLYVRLPCTSQQLFILVFPELSIIPGTW